jgi:hypothetical protein
MLPQIPPLDPNLNLSIQLISALTHFQHHLLIYVETRRMKWTGTVARMGENEVIQSFFGGGKVGGI